MKKSTLNDQHDNSRRYTVERLRRQLPTGTRIVLVEMNDVQAPPVGTKGTVRGVDDAANILVDWDNGSGLNLIYGVDRYSELPEDKTKN